MSDRISMAGFFVVLPAVFFAALAVAFPASADDGKNMAALTADVDSLEHAFEQTAQMLSDNHGQLSNRIVTSRIIEAKQFIEDGQNKKAIERLLMPALSERFANHPGRAEAVVLLAEACQREGWLRLARHYAARILDKDTPNEYRMQAAAVWLSTSVQLRDLGRIDGPAGLYPIAEVAKNQKSPAALEVRFQYARALIAKGQADEALLLLNGIPDDSPVGLKARFAKATILAQKGKLDEAAKIFRGLQDAREFPEAVPEEARVALAEAANLAQARIAYATGNHRAAWDGYSFTRPESPQFTQAVYETIWLFDSAGRHDDAVAALQGYKQLISPHERAVWTAVLPGVLLQRAGKYDEAANYFTALARQMEGWESEIAARHGSVEKYLENIFIRVSNSGSGTLAEEPDELGLLPGIQLVVDTARKINELEEEREEIGELGQQISWLSGLVGEHAPPLREVDTGMEMISRLREQISKVRQQLSGDEQARVLGRTGILLAQAGPGGAWAGGNQAASRGAGFGGLQAKLDRLEMRVDSLEKELDARREQLSGEVLRDLAAERQNLSAYEQEISTLSEQLNLLGGELKTNTVQKMPERQQALYMRAQYGISETALYAKTNLEQRTNKLLNAKVRELDDLDSLYLEGSAVSPVEQFVPQEKTSAYSGKPADSELTPIPARPPIQTDSPQESGE